MIFHIYKVCLSLVYRLARLLESNVAVLNSRLKLTIVLGIPKGSVQYARGAVRTAPA